MSVRGHFSAGIKRFGSFGKGLGAAIPVLSRAIQTIARSALRGLYRDEFPSSPMTRRLYPSKNWRAKRKGDLP
ncbi:hypothetical protein CSIRO_1382 [Bradyrhizobiaceae bacterium SG-6C]|nr:hypothetical protein CSIRO_1382 [Bradyrhizobiaceae bacterium SG-6C]